MTKSEIEAKAQQLYDECQTSKPAWGQLGEVTKGVWRGYAAGESRLIGPAAAKPAPKKPASKFAKYVKA